MGASDCGSVKGAGEICLGWGSGGIYVCDRAGKKGRGSKRKGVQCMCERVCMQLDEKWSVD